jgi:uncharacterized lipoprotein NlpE involved in copper resistance
LKKDARQNVVFTVQRMKGNDMGSPWAYQRFLEYGAVFPEIAELLNASGVKAEVQDNADKTGLLVEVTLPNRSVAVLSEEGHWSVHIDGNATDLGIPVENRDAKAIAAALLKTIGK